MHHRHVGRTAALALVLGMAAAPMLAAQARRTGAERETATVKVALKAPGGAVTADGPGTCTHAGTASIYGVMSEMWMVRQQSGQNSTQLTMWRPRDGKEAMFSLSLSGARDVSISTVRGGTVTGTGTVRFDAKGKGGVFTVDAKGKSGDTVSGTIECSAFSAAVAEGG